MVIPFLLRIQPTNLPLDWALDWVAKECFTDWRSRHQKVNPVTKPELVVSRDATTTEFRSSTMYASRDSGLK
jgi:hypothetical protein